MLRNILRGLIFLSVLYLSALLGSIVLMGPTLPLLWLRPSWFRLVNDRVITWWLYLPSAFLEIMFGVKIIVTGDKLPKSESAIIIMNHRCRLDWMFYWSVIARYGELKHEKIIMKSELKNIPGPGWAMQNALYIFLKRRWDEDESYLNTVLSFFVDVLYPLQLLIFPEGTNFDDRSKAKSDSFAEKNGLPCYEYVLHPRVRGFTFCVEKLRQGRLDAVHDVTVGYSENYCFQELDLLKGKVPDEIHFHINRYPNEELPKDTQGLEEWCANRWKEKEHRLKTFYNQEKYFIPPLKLANDKLDEVEVTVRYLMKKDLIFWAAFGCSFSLLIYFSVWFRWYIVCMVVLFTVLSVCGGTDKIFLQSQKTMTFKGD